MNSKAQHYTSQFTYTKLYRSCVDEVKQVFRDLTASIQPSRVRFTHQNHRSLKQHYQI
ncbi:MAG: hypothetical protein O2966_01050 [Proteobacteria bacterium]|nr:hypothetical protein [Pseudomonadota bacterium]